MEDSKLFVRNLPYELDVLVCPPFFVNCTFFILYSRVFSHTQELEEYFSHFGPVSRVSLISDSSGNPRFSLPPSSSSLLPVYLFFFVSCIHLPRGFGFVKFPTAETCQAALTAFRSSGADQVFKGRKLHAEVASDPKLKGKRKTKGVPTPLRLQQHQEQQEERKALSSVPASSVDARRVCVSLNDMAWPSEESEDGEKERKKIYKNIKKVLFLSFVCVIIAFFSFFSLPFSVLYSILETKIETPLLEIQFILFIPS